MSALVIGCVCRVHDGAGCRGEGEGGDIHLRLLELELQAGDLRFVLALKIPNLGLNRLPLNFSIIELGFNSFLLSLYSFNSFSRFSNSNSFSFNFATNATFTFPWVSAPALVIITCSSI